jgi:hypothetical protein
MKPILSPKEHSMGHRKVSYSRRFVQSSYDSKSSVSETRHLQTSSNRNSLHYTPSPVVYLNRTTFHLSKVALIVLLAFMQFKGSNTQSNANPQNRQQSQWDQKLKISSADAKQTLQLSTEPRFRLNANPQPMDVSQTRGM